MNATYRYALNRFGKVQDVTVLERKDVEQLEPFICVGCKGNLIARLGQKMIKHFAHASGEGCAGETYLHNLGKNVFFETYNDCLESGIPFILELDTEVSCSHFENKIDVSCSEIEKVTHDLTTYFDTVFMECHHDGFVPDIMLKSSRTGETVYIEIAVTHRSSDEKIRSSNRIIEYQLESEEDIPFLRSPRVQTEAQRIHLYNFNAKPLRRDICNGSCKKTFSCFVIDYKGRASVIESTPSKLVERINNDSVVISSLCRNEDKVHFEFHSFIKRAVKDGVRVRSCFVCKNVKHDKENNYLHCQKNFKYVPSYEALRCRDFSVIKV